MYRKFPTPSTVYLNFWDLIYLGIYSQPISFLCVDSPRTFSLEHHVLLVQNHEALLMLS